MKRRRGKKAVGILLAAALFFGGWPKAAEAAEDAPKQEELLAHYEFLEEEGILPEMEMMQ